MTRLLPLLLLGCAPPADPIPCDPDPGGLLIASTTDFTTGAVAALDVAGDALWDPAAPAGGDPVVRALGDGRVALLERGGGHHLRLYTPGCWAAPELEVGLSGANPHDVLLHDGELWLAPYEHAALWVLDPEDGQRIAEVDLSPWADDDGLPEPHALALHQGRLFAALQRLDRAGGSRWTDAGGLVVEVDPERREVVASHPVGPSPRLYAEEDGLVVVTGMYALLDGQEETFTPDGGVARLDPDSGALTVVWTEEAAGYDFHAWAGVGEVDVVVGVDPVIGGPGRLTCIDRQTGEVQHGPTSPGWYADVAATGDGEAWLSVRSGFLAPGTGAGLVPLDPTTCETGEPVELTLEPFALTWRSPTDAVFRSSSGGEPPSGR